MTSQSAVRFFFKHAGYSYNPKTETATQGRWRGARELAAAERRADEMGFTFEWVLDFDGCIGCACECPDCPCSAGTTHETLGCVVRNVTNTRLASLWGICEPSVEYRRVVEAELAMEAIGEIERELDKEATSAGDVPDAREAEGQ